MINNKGLFFSFLIGGVIGSIIALLYAPKPGKRLRNDISKKTNEYLKEGKKKTIETMNDVKEKVETTLGNANDFLNSGMEKIERKSEK
ncbi:MAG: YtxH domain-containing protein [Ignavibacteriae bacterium]|nr:MAG: YtxH domain-containing protein [Ignavibacteriota bacterium]